MRLIWPTIQAMLLHIVVAVVLVWTFDVSPAIKEFDLSNPAIEWVDLPPKQETVAQPQQPAPPVRQPQAEPEPQPQVDRAAELALKRKEEAEQREREAEAQRKREAERRQAEAERQREEQARREKEAQEAEARKVEQAEREREERIEAEQQRLSDLREQRLAEMQDRLAQEQAADAAAQQQQQAQASRQASEVESFMAGIRMQLQRQWRRPASANNDMQVLLLIELLPTGELRDVSILQSSGDRLFDRSAVEAVESVTRFSVPKDPNMFEQNFRSLNLLFDPEDLF